ncbi:Membrane protein involved in the export of O-antigen and teichoic acid [Halorientalis persicus]|uniref:Membrane protein involved in the export of O-antigen and teichoic acid n=1 Tax=Halorientalis persicus TaxID=1367881 RepID=A0A1H8V4Q0_9EURY|nr:oligosaccharide flippase family protein [Halorientalis persicus]SEP10472.1 Membrane protein involved in the export of O-antigen and teichoic acid [Halorientalis persicus]
MRFKREIITVFGSSILRNVATFVAVAYFSRELGLATLGSFFLFQSILLTVSIPVDFGIKIGVEKRISEGNSPADTLATAIVVKFILLLLSIAAIFGFSGVINSYVGENVAILLAIALILNELGQLGKHTLRGEQRVGVGAILQSIQTLIWALFGVGLTLLGFTNFALFWAYLIGLFVISFFYWYQVDTKIGNPSISHAKAIVGYSKFALIGSLGGLTYNWADIILLGFFISQSAVGAYEVAWRVSAASLLLTNAVRTTVFPKANELGEKGEIEQLERLVESSLIPSFYFVIPAAIGGSIIGGEILSLAFEAEYPLLNIALVILLIEKVQRALLLPLIGPMHGIGHVDYGAYTTIFGLVTNIMFNLLLIPPFGILGAAVGTTIGSTATTTSYVWLLSNEISISIPTKEIIWLGLSGSVMGVAIFTVKPLLLPISLIDLTGIIIGAAIVYIVASLSIRKVRIELRNTLQSII